MAKFVLLYSGGGMAPTKAEQEMLLQAWGAWFAQLGPNLVDGGSPFTGQAKSVSSGGSVSDGPVGMMATGYSIINADSLEAAVEEAKNCPVLQGDNARVTVYEAAMM